MHKVKYNAKFKNNLHRFDIDFNIVSINCSLNDIDVFVFKKADTLFHKGDIIVGGIEWNCKDKQGNVAPLARKVTLLTLAHLFYLSFLGS